MSAVRSCLPCRTAKAKCDRGRPACGRCVRRGLQCSGFSPDAFIFRDENEVAERNSRRARGEVIRQNPLGNIVQAQQALPAAEPFDWELMYPWLNQRALLSIPEPLRRDLETRAVERFFVNWILYPGQNGLSPGHMHDLPMLYYNSPLDSPLWHAVRAIAFADLKNVRDADVPFYVKARRSYGAALAQLRATTENEQELATDRVFAALLMIDSFETMYLAQVEPLGLHSDAVKFILQARGNDQLYDRSRFGLWTHASHRLLSRQILRGEEPDPVQIEFLSKLNIDRPDIHIAADVLRIATLSAAAKNLIKTQACEMEPPPERSQQARNLSNIMQELIANVDGWTANKSDLWLPKHIDSDQIQELEHTDLPEDHPLHHFYCPRLLVFPEIWMAFICNFHQACQIVLRESFIGVMRYRLAIDGVIDGDEYDAIQLQRDAVERLSGSIIRSFPLLMGFTDGSGEHLEPPPQGRMAGRFLALFAMEVIRKAEFTSEEHKHTASRVLEWSYASHALC